MDTLTATQQTAAAQVAKNVPITAAISKVNVKTLLAIGSDKDRLQGAQHAAARKLLHFDGEIYPSDGCAITQSVLLQEAGLNLPDTYMAIALGRLLKDKYNWAVIPVGEQKAGDIGSTCGSAPHHGVDHVYLVLRVLNEGGEMVIADNQVKAPHFRWANGKGGKSPTRFFLRAPS